MEKGIQLSLFIVNWTDWMVLFVISWDVSMFLISVVFWSVQETVCELVHVNAPTHTQLLDLQL